MKVIIETQYGDSALQREEITANAIQAAGERVVGIRFTDAEGLGKVQYIALDGFTKIIIE